MKKLLAAAFAACTIPLFPVLPAAANCYGTWGSYGYSGTCSGYSNGSSYRLNVNGSGSGYGSTQVYGTVDGSSVRGSVNGSTFRGTVDGRYVTCGRFGCY
jgi:hypothetical protein